MYYFCKNYKYVLTKIIYSLGPVFNLVVANLNIFGEINYLNAQ